MNRLDGKLALVTGAGSGIGAGIARRFRAEGAQLIINDLRREAAEATAKEVDGDAIVADVSDSAASRACSRRLRSATAASTSW